MKSKYTEPLCLRVAGTLLLMIGLGHILMPTLGYEPATPEGMSESVRNHFYYLGTYAISGFLLSLGLLSHLFSWAPSTWASRVFSVVMTSLWVARLGLEFVYPVDLPIFILATPHPWLVLVLVCITAAFAMAALTSHAPLSRPLNSPPSATP